MAHEPLGPAAFLGEVLNDLAKTIDARAGADPASSWTAKLLMGGPALTAKKLGEEGGALATQLQAAVPGGGPYDVQETLDEQLRRLPSSLRRLLDPGNLSKLPGSVRDELRRLLLRQMVPEDADVTYQTLFLDRYLADDKESIARDTAAGSAA